MFMEKLNIVLQGRCDVVERCRDQVYVRFLLTLNHILGSCCLPRSARGENIQILSKINSKPMSYWNYLSISRALRLVAK